MTIGTPDPRVRDRIAVKHRHRASRVLQRLAERALVGVGSHVASQTAEHATSVQVNARTNLGNPKRARYAFQAAYRETCQWPKSNDARIYVGGQQAGVLARAMLIGS